MAIENAYATLRGRFDVLARVFFVLRSEVGATVLSPLAKLCFSALIRSNTFPGVRAGFGLTICSPACFF